MSFRWFPSRIQKFVRLTSKQAYESLLYLTGRKIGAENFQSETEEKPYVEAKIGGAIGAVVSIRILPEDGACTLVFSFSYEVPLVTILAVLAAVVALSLILNTVVPMVGLIIVLPLILWVNAGVSRFLDTVNETLPRLEEEYAHMALMEARKRWQREPKDTEALYRKLCKKHVKTWGKTYALDYKIAEYEKQGLTREEAVRKTADEEGIF